LRKDLEDFVTEIRNSLKDNLSKSTSGSERMTILLNTFTLVTISQTDLGDQNPIMKASTGIRKIIF
jgi:hypothetical protein